MYDHQLFLKTLSEFSGALRDPHDSHRVLSALADRVSQVLDLAGSGVSLARVGRLELDAANGSDVAEIERTQERTQRGPCVTAFRTEQAVAVPILTRERERWPGYCSVAARAGIDAVASIPMRLGEETLGVLNLYARGSRDWSEEDLAVATAMADLATAYLINAAEHDKQVELNRELQDALDSRVIIEQAKGALAARHQITPDAAFERLRGHARRHRAELRSVAEAVVNKSLEI
jgi:GAF domain-containing protein